MSHLNANLSNTTISLVQTTLLSHLLPNSNNNNNMSCEICFTRIRDTVITYRHTRSYIVASSRLCLYSLFMQNWHDKMTKYTDI